MTIKKFVAKNGLDNNGQTITNVADPVDMQDVATRNFTSNAANITSGVLDSARVPNLDWSKISTGKPVTLDGYGIATIDGTLEIGYKIVPQNIQSVSYTLALTDSGKHIYSTNTGAQTITVPLNADVAFPIGAAITLVNNGTDAIILNTTGVTVYKSGTAAVWPSGGTLGVRGLATLLKVDTDTWFISGGILT